MTLNSFFEGLDRSRELYEEVAAAIQRIGPSEARISKSQIAFRRRRAFAWTWIPGKYLRRRSAPLVLTIALRRRDSSSRWKQIVEPYPGRFIHHLELLEIEEINEEIRALLVEAWNLAG